MTCSQADHGNGSLASRSPSCCLWVKWDGGGPCSAVLPVKTDGGDALRILRGLADEELGACLAAVACAFCGGETRVQRSEIIVTGALPGPPCQIPATSRGGKVGLARWASGTFPGIQVRLGRGAAAVPVPRRPFSRPALWFGETHGMLST